MREIIISECINLLKTHNFIVSKPLGRSCFDILACRDDVKLILKILKNIDSISREQSIELKKICRVLSAVPLIIGVRTRNAPMERGIVYDRYNIKSVTLETLKDFLEGSPPIIYAYRGGCFVKIDGETLKRVREERGISAGKLAEMVGVSRKAIYKYETYSANPSVEVAMKIEECLDAPLVRGIDLFEPIEDENDKNIEEDKPLDDYKQEIINIFNSLGFKSFVFEKAPFDALEEGKEKKKNIILLTNIEERANEDVEQRALIVKELSKLINGFSVLILKKKEKEYKNIPVISTKELEKMDDVNDLLEYLKMFYFKT
ncbi:transcriptional regulator [Methanocaldococcus indicus]|uniref:transcriptional regulator n=1 Tax=Methanocaldococcus indicus TaxID=213231 RepID=UPI003C6CCE1F